MTTKTKAESKELRKQKSAKRALRENNNTARPMCNITFSVGFNLNWATSNSKPTF